MLVPRVAAIQDSVVFVSRWLPAASGPPGQVSVFVAGTACYVGNDRFLTVEHLFRDPPVAPGQVIRVGSIGGGRVRLWDATIEWSSSALDLAILRSVGCGNALPAAPVSIGVEPCGRSVFTYGAITPSVQSSPQGMIWVVRFRACPSSIGFSANEQYELDGNTYPGESGAPVFRASDNVLIGAVQSSRGIEVPDPNDKGSPRKMTLVRGPTFAGTTASIAQAIANCGVVTVP